MKTIDEIRKEIDMIDGKLLNLFLQRLELVEQIGEIKKKNNIPVLNQNRQDEILGRLTEKVSQAKKDSVLEFFNNIFKISRNLQKK